MRLFAISDLHGDRDLAERAAREAAHRSAEAIIIAGDLSERGTEFEGLIEPFAQLEVPLLLIAGNHDDHTRMRALAERYDAIDLDGYGVVINGVGFIGTRGLNIGCSQQSPEQMRESLLRSARYTHAERIVSVTHGHPSGTEMDALSPFVHGSETIEALIRELSPHVHVCGHVHEGAGLIERIATTKLVNVARAPTIIDI